MANQISETIAAIESFVPTDDDTDNVYHLYQIFDGFRSLSHRERAVLAMFSLIERFPEADLGSPGPLVHELEDIPEYQPSLRESLHRQPTDLTVWMVNRILNSQLDQAQREMWLNELRAALAHPLSPTSTKESAYDFLQHQRAAA